MFYPTKYPVQRVERYDVFRDFYVNNAIQFVVALRDIPRSNHNLIGLRVCFIAI